MRQRVGRGTAVLLVWFIAASALAGVPSAARAQAGPASLSMADAVRLALDSHPGVAAARAGESESSAAVREARAAWLPSLSAAGWVTRYQKPSITQPFHGLTPGAAPEFDRTSIRGELKLGYTLFDGGARSARIEGAHALEAAAGADLTGVRMQLTSSVAAAYLAVLTSRGSVEAQSQRLEALGAELQRIEQLQAEGRAAEVERLRVEADVARTEAARLTAAARLEDAERELARLVGGTPQRTRADRLIPVRLTSAAPAPARLEAARADFTRRARQRSPALRAAHQRAAAAHAERAVARAAWFPRLELGGRYQSFGSGSGDYSAEWQGGLQLSYPLFTGGARSAAVARSTARETAAAERERMVALVLDGQVDEAITSVREAYARAAALTSAVDHLAEVSRIEKLALVEGVGEQSDYLRGLADLAEARAARIEAKNREIAGRMELARLTGDLTLKWLERNVEGEG